MFAGISAVAAAVQEWVDHQDRHKADEASDATLKHALGFPETAAVAIELAAIVPGEVIKDLEAQTDSCWRGYQKVLGGDYLPDEVEKQQITFKPVFVENLNESTS